MAAASRCGKGLDVSQRVSRCLEERPAVRRRVVLGLRGTDRFPCSPVSVGGSRGLRLQHREKPRHQADVLSRSSSSEPSTSEIRVERPRLAFEQVEAEAALRGPHFPFVLETKWIEFACASESPSIREAFFVSLLDSVAELARPPISKFHVAAIGLGASGRAFLGVNLEFPGLPLHHSVHAEQFVVANAIQHGERRLHTLIVSHAPCGHCRQFLQELRHAGGIRVVIADSHAEASSLEHFLPHRFGPHDLLHDEFPLLLESRHNQLKLRDSLSSSHAMAPSTGPNGADSSGNGGITAATSSLDQLALEAANSSYAPYSESPSGIALATVDGRVYAGAYMESAAYNPSLPPLQAALVAFVSQGGNDFKDISQVVLVEKSDAQVSFRETTQLCVSRISPKATFEVFEALL